MKKTLRTILTCVLIYILSFSITAAVLGIEPKERDMINAEAMQMADTVNPLPEYIVKEYNDVVAVFLNDGAIPMIETDIPVSGLRNTDRELMEEGIALQSYTEVLGLLEDFNS